MSSLDLVKKINEIIEEKKGEHVRIINISDVTTIADYFIIASANNPNQLTAISDEIQDKLGKEGILARSIEGMRNAGWTLLDYQDVVVHLFLKEERAFYDIERIWSDGVNVEL